ncbi:MAG: endonuclease/exonuclease/phosphatase family protein [Pseudomonadota bacterium]
MTRPLTISLVLSLVALAGCEAWSDLEDYEREEVPVFQADHLTPPFDDDPSVLRVMSYNFKFGGGRIDFFFDYWGDRATMTVAEVEGNLDALYRLIEEVRPHVLLAQEVEVNSKRSAYVDMVQRTLDLTHLNYGAFYEAWDTRFAPDESTGRVHMGNAIFSVFPITSAERIRQADRTDQAIYESYFLLHRSLGRAEIQAGNTQLAAYVVHTEAYDQDGTKKKHVEQVHQLLAEEVLPALMGGDFNSVPPTALKKEKFNDDAPESLGTRYESPPYDLTTMQGFYDDFVPAIALDRIGDTPESQRRHFSHTIIGPGHEGNDGKPAYWNRTLDYLWTKAPLRWVDGSTDTLQGPGRLGIVSDPMTLSDHCPVVGDWEVRP